MSDPVRQLFLEEAQELLQILEAELLNLKTQPDIAALMRAAHTLKGSGAMVGLTAIPAIAHRLEDVFGIIARAAQPIDDGLEALLLQAYDHLERPIAEDLRGGHHDEALTLTQAEPVLAALDEWLTGQEITPFEELEIGELEAEASATEALETEIDALAVMAQATPGLPPIDMITVLFTGDVVSGLETLAAGLREEPSVRQEVLRSQLDAFVGIGELTSLPGFTAIARAGLTALTARPSQSLEIGEQVLDNLQAAQAAVLAGDRQRGGEPSPTLLAFGDPPSPTVPLPTVPSPTDSMPTMQVLAPAEQTNTALWEETSNEASDEAMLLSLFGEEEEEEETTALRPADPICHAADPSAITPPTPPPPVDDSGSPNSASDVSLTSAQAAARLHRPITSGLPNALIAKLEALLNSAPPEINARRRPPKANLSRPAPSTAPAQPPKKTVKPPKSKTVRVSLDRLNRLNNLFGELVTYENKNALQAQQLQYVISSMTQRFRNFERITRSLQDWADQSQQDRAKLMASAANSEEFDPLQMDSYDNAHLLMQEVMEEIAQLGETIHDMTAITHQGQQVHRQKQQTLRQIRNDLIRTSMMPMGDLLRHFPRMVRDLSAKYGKQVKMEVYGSDTLVDRTVFEKLYDPLVHLVRNAFDHGIEHPVVRSQLKKSSQATISLRAYGKSHQTYLEVSDDGCGISLERVRNKAIERGLYTTAEAAKLKPDQLYDCLFQPGFSTAAVVSELSGRGVGLDVVATQIKQLKGEIKVISTPNGGTTFVLRFPLSLNVAELMVFSVGNRTFAIAMDAVKTILSVATEDIAIGDETPFYQWQGQPVPLYSRSTLLNHYPLRGRRSRDSLPAIPLPKDGKVPLIILGSGARTLALQIDNILQAQELTIKPFGAAIQPPAFLLGCTTLGDGSLIPVVDGQALISRHFDPRSESRPGPPASPEARVAAAIPPTESEPPAEPQTILVVDDSLTARQVLIFTLEKAGYQTLQAKDGRDAMEQLSQNFAEIQAVFCDVEMPRMNGFEFLSQCRQDHGEKAPPVIMLTSRSGDKHRETGKTLGASAYLTKPYLEQALLDTLTACLTASSD